MGGPALAFGLLATAACWAAPAAAAPPPASLGELEGRGPAPVGVVAGEVGAGAPVLRFASPAGGRSELVLYVAARPARGSLELADATALASLLGVPGEIRLEAGRARRARPEPSPLETAPEPVPEPGPWLLLGLGLAGLAGACHPARRWSGRPRG
jgi:hypothetical protein